jgi:hypothetical protein
MWIITRDGFVSLVEHNTDPNLIRVRARRSEHLQETFDLQDGDIIDLGENAPDYRWHADIPRANVAQKMHDAVMELDYTSHVKEEVAGDDNQMYQAMLACWTALHRLQDPPRPERDWWTYDEWEARNREAVFVHKAEPEDDGALWCKHCNAAIHRVQGGQGPTWVHSTTGAVAASGAPVVDAPTLGDLGDLAGQIGELAGRMLKASEAEPESDGYPGPLTVARWPNMTVDTCIVCDNEFHDAQDYVTIPEDSTYGEPEGPAHVECAEAEGWEIQR